MAEEVSDLTGFWPFLSSTLQQLTRHHNTDDVVLAERLLSRTEDCEAVLSAVLSQIVDQLGIGNDTVGEISTLIQEVERHREHYADWILRIEPHCTDNVLSLGCPLQTPMGVGRPAYEIRKEDIESLVEMGFSFQQCARILGVSERTLRRRREVFGLPIGSSYSNISDGELDQIVRSILEITMDSGLCYVRGALLSRGIIVQRQRVIDCMRRVDPVSQSLRRIARVHRREYWVPGPNALWHVDGHHKIIRWKFVIHGGIDGFSRLIVYLQCSNNNLSSTVMNCLRQAVDQHGLPSRVRCDLGVENVDIARFMITARGVGRGSIITGSSTHNQRVERMWRDVHRVVVRQFKNLFGYIESTGCLNPLDDVHLFALHYVYMPRINQALNEFTSQHNHHRLRTEHNLTPQQLFFITPRTCDPLSVDWDSYGVDTDGPVPTDNMQDNGIIVIPPHVDISEEQLAQLPNPPVTLESVCICLC